MSSEIALFNVLTIGTRFTQWMHNALQAKENSAKTQEARPCGSIALGKKALTPILWFETKREREKWGEETMYKWAQIARLFQEGARKYYMLISKM